MSEVTEKKLATKKTILQEAKVCCEPHYSVTRFCRTEEARAEALEEWCREFNAFIRDHRHQDGTHLSVDRVMADTCSACGADWEVMPADAECPHASCANCGTEIAK